MPNYFLRISLLEPRTHTLGLDLELDALDDGITLWLPAWTPGSYLIRDFARHLFGMRATDPRTGAAIPVERIDLAAWRLPAGTRRARLSYRVYAHTLSPRTSDFDDHHATLNFANVALSADGLARMPLSVALHMPASWRCDGALACDEGQIEGCTRTVTLEAPDYDTLVDSPVLCGHHERHDFEVAGVPHRFAISGAPPASRDALLHAATRLIETHARVFGGLPYRRYVVLLDVAPEAKGGLEHRDSALLGCKPQALDPTMESGKTWRRLVGLLAHETFHAWNGKRARPFALGPFDYTRPTPTRALWVVEGLTTYYDHISPARAGVWSARETLDTIGETWLTLESSPGRFVQSLEDASYEAWIKFYKPDESSGNLTVSYYVKGALVGLALDLAIRERTGGTRSLDDVMRLLHDRFASPRPGYRDEDVFAIVQEGAGCDLEDILQPCVRGTQDPDLEGALGRVGLRVRREWEASHKASVGVTLRDGDRVVLDKVRSGSAAERAGLSPDDEIVAIEKTPVDPSSAGALVGSRSPGEEIEITYAHRGRLCTTRATLEVPPPDRIRIEAAPEASVRQKARFEAWLGARFATLEAVTG